MGYHGEAVNFVKVKLRKRDKGAEVVGVKTKKGTAIPKTKGVLGKPVAMKKGASRPGVDIKDPATNPTSSAKKCISSKTSRSIERDLAEAAFSRKERAEAEESTIESLPNGSSEEAEEADWEGIIEPDFTLPPSDDDGDYNGNHEVVSVVSEDLSFEEEPLPRKRKRQRRYY
ncbi:MAG: hypothetical protein M1819_007274 [Sarea resinae]|nr:MAG: hypothetical protein M1819_007274 [Sarea resinae]